MPVSTSERAIALILLAALNAFGFIDRVVVALVAEKIKAEYLVSDFEIGLLGGTAFAVVNTLASVPIARLAERYSRAKVTAGFMFIGSVFTALMGLTANFAQLLAARLGMAVGSAATEAPPHSMISDMYPPEKRASAISLYMLGVPTAALVGSFLGGSIAESYGWRGTFLFFGLAGGAVTLLCLLFLKEPARQTRPDHGAPNTSALKVLRILWNEKALRHILAGTALMSLGSYGVNTFLPSFFARNFALDAAGAGFAFGLISGIAAFVGTLVGGFGSEYLARRDPRWLLGFPALGTVIGVPLFIMGVMSANLFVAVPVMVIGCIAFYTAMGPVIATVHGSLDSWNRALGSALFLLLVNIIGQGFGPPVAGLVSDMISAVQFGSGNFAAECAGAAGQVVGSACAQASAAGIKYAIAIFSVFYLWAGLHLFLGAQSRFRSDPAR